jgi:hypothetical protein
MIAAMENPKTSFPLLGMAALIIFVVAILLAPLWAQHAAPLQATSPRLEGREMGGGIEALALENPNYQEPFDATIVLPAVTAAETPVLVRTAHGSRHGDVRNCFQGPNDLLFYIEAGSGRVHVICRVTETEFYDLIVKDRRAITGYIEEVTVFKVNQYPTVAKFIEYLTSRASFPCTQFVDDWLNAVIRFVFLQ